MAANGGRPAGPSPLPPTEPGTATLEVDRIVSKDGLVSLSNHRLLAAEILGGRRALQLVGDALAQAEKVAAKAADNGQGKRSSTGSKGDEPVTNEPDA